MKADENFAHTILTHSQQKVILPLSGFCVHFFERTRKLRKSSWMVKVVLRMVKITLRIVKIVLGMIKVALGMIKVVLGFKMDY